MADSQIVYTEMVAERKTEESIPYGSKTHRGYTEETYPLACVLRRGMLKGMLTRCVRIASDPPCFYCSLPSAWKWGLCPIWVPGLCFRVCFGYALGMLSCVDTIIHFVGKGHSPLHRPRIVPPNHTPKRAKKA